MESIEIGLPGKPETLEIFGPVLAVQIGLDPDWKTASRQLPDLPDRRWQALLDTGGEASMIDIELAQRLGLPIVDEGKVRTAAGTMDTDIYRAQIVEPTSRIIYHSLFHGTMLSSGGMGHDAVLGRDFLRRFTLEYKGETGSVILKSQ